MEEKASSPASTLVSTAISPLKTSENAPQVLESTHITPSSPSKPTAETSSSTAQLSQISVPTSASATPSHPKAKPASKPIRVRTNGASLWEKAINNANAPPHEYRKLAIHFNSTIPEIFDRLCYYLDAVSIFGLFITGDKRMQARIVNTVVDLRFVRNEGLNLFQVQTNKWPAFTKYFSKLRHLTLKYKPVEDSKSTNAAADLSMVSSTLDTLYLDCNFNKYEQLANFKHLESLTIAHFPSFYDRSSTPFPAELLPPYLTYLDLAMQMTLPAAIPLQLEKATEEQQYLVPGLQSLKHLMLRTESALPSSFFALLNPDIEAIHLPLHSGFCPEWLILLPKKLTALTVNLKHTTGLLDFLPALPPSLVDFSIILAPNLNHTHVSAFPKSLTRCRFPGAFDSHLELLQAWPLPNLKELIVSSNAPRLAIASLPEGLKSLRLDGHVTSAEFAPEGLTSLVLRHTRFNDDFIRVTPRNLTKLKLPGSPLTSRCLGALPLNLTTLSLGGNFLNGDMEHFPPKITKLTLANTTALTDICAPSLPRRLRILRIPKNPLWHYSCVPDLPSCLEVINFSASLGEFANLPALKHAYFSEQRKIQERKRRSLMSVAGPSTQIVQ